MWHHHGMWNSVRSPGRALLASFLVFLGLSLMAPTANGQPDGTFRGLSAAEELKVVDNKAYIPGWLGIMDTYTQDFPPQGLEVLLCYDADFKPLMLAKAAGAWMAMQGNGGVGLGVYLYEYPNKTSARAAGRTLQAVKCARESSDPKAQLTQSQRTLPKKSGAAGMLITTTYVDDGELDTTVSAVRQIGLAVLKVSATYQGAADSALGKSVEPAVTNTLDLLTANYVKAASS